MGCCEYHTSLLAAAVAALLGWDLGPGVQGRRVLFLTVEKTTVVYIFSPVFSPSAPYWVWHHPSIALVCMVFPKASSFFFLFFPLFLWVTPFYEPLLPWIYKPSDPSLLLLSWSCFAALFFFILEKLYSLRFQCWDFGAEITSLLLCTPHDRLRCWFLCFSPDWDEISSLSLLENNPWKPLLHRSWRNMFCFQQSNVQILQLWCQGKQIECIQSEPLMVSSVDWVHIQSEPLMVFSVDWVYIWSEPFDGFLSSPGIAHIKYLLSLALEIHFNTDSCVSWPIVFNLSIDQAGAHTISIKNKDGNSDKFSNCSGFDGLCMVESTSKSPKKNSTGMMVEIL